MVTPVPELLTTELVSCVPMPPPTMMYVPCENVVVPFITEMPPQYVPGVSVVSLLRLSALALALQPAASHPPDEEQGEGGARFFSGSGVVGAPVCGFGLKVPCQQ